MIAVCVDSAEQLSNRVYITQSLRSYPLASQVMDDGSLDATASSNGNERDISDLKTVFNPETLVKKGELRPLRRTGCPQLLFHTGLWVCLMSLSFWFDCYA